MLYEIFLIDRNGRIIVHIDLTRESKSYLLKKEKLMLDLVRSLGLLSKELIRKKAERIVINNLSFYIDRLFDYTLVAVADATTFADIKFIKNLLMKEINKEGSINLARNKISRIREIIINHHTPSINFVIEMLRNNIIQTSEKNNKTKDDSKISPISFSTSLDTGIPFENLEIEETTLEQILNPDIYYRPQDLVPKALYLVKNYDNPVVKAFSILILFKAWEYDCSPKRKVRIRDLYSLITNLKDPFLRELFEHKLESYLSIIKVESIDTYIKLASRLLLKLKEEKKTKLYREFIEAFLNDYYYGIPLPNRIIENNPDLSIYRELLNKLREITRDELLNDILSIVGSIKVSIEKLTNQEKNNLLVSYYDTLSELTPLIHSTSYDKLFSFDLMNEIIKRILHNNIDKLLTLDTCNFKSKFDAISKLISFYTIHKINDIQDRSELRNLLEITEQALKQYYLKRPYVLIKPLHDIAITTTLYANKYVLEKALNGKDIKPSLINYLDIIDSLSSISDIKNPRVQARIIQIITNLSILLTTNEKGKDLLRDIISELQRITSSIRFVDFSYCVINCSLRQLTIIENLI